MERRGQRTGNKPVTNKERRAQWEKDDGLDLSEFGARDVRMQRLMRVIKEPRGSEYGPEHEEALAEAHAIIYGFGLDDASTAGLIVSATKDIVGRDNRTPEADEAYYQVRHETLPRLMGARFFTKCGKELGAALEQKGQIERSDIVGPNARTDLFPTLTSVPAAVASQVLKRFNEYGLTQYGIDMDDLNEDGDVPDVSILTEEEKDERTFVAIGTIKKAAQYLSEGQVETARMMSSFSSIPKEIKSIADIKERLEKHNEESRVDTITIKTNSNSIRMESVNELRIGHQDGLAGIELLEREVERIKQLPDDKKPHVLTVHNLIQSDFASHQARKRQANAKGLNSKTEQYSAANEILDLLKSTGIPVIVSTGPDDEAMADDAAKEIVQEIRGAVRIGGKENFISYYESNQLIQDPGFQMHKLFYLEHIIPLQYRMGRRLREKNEVQAATGGELNYSEYFALFNHIVHGEELPEELGIDPDIIAEMAEWRDGVTFVNDFNLVAETEGKERDIASRHNTNFTAESLKLNHMKSIMEQLGSVAASEGTDDMADLILTGRQQQAYSLANRAISLPGLWDTGKSLNRKSYYANAPGDASRRSNFNRGVPGVPTLTTVEITDDDRLIQMFTSKEFLDKADSLPRTAIFEFCDQQIGSISARPDIQIMYLSYMLEVAKEMPIAIQFAGDMIHGNIYTSFANESQSVGLISLTSQKIMMRTIMERVFDTSDPIIKGLLENVIDCVVQPGNHDKQMRAKNLNGVDDNVDYLEMTMKDILGKDRVRSEKVKNIDGTPVASWAARTHLGAYSILTAHYHIQKFGRGGGGYPVSDAFKRVQGMGEKSPDILLGAHWHNPQTAMFGNILSVIGGPMAGQTEFEDFGGMKARPFGTVVKIGGKEPVAVESLSAETLRLGGSSKTELRGGKVITGAKYGQFTPDKLAERGLVDDEGFDPRKHGIFMHRDFPKNALQKALLLDVEDASHLINHRGETENPYDKGEINELTRRAFEIAARQQQQVA